MSHLHNQNDEYMQMQTYINFNVLCDSISSEFTELSKSVIELVSCSAESMTLREGFKKKEKKKSDFYHFGV